MSAHVAVGITGASGSAYGLRLVSQLAARGMRVSLVVTAAGCCVMKEETGVEAEESDIRRHVGDTGSLVRLYRIDDFGAAIASGSGGADAMVICPCSMGTLARVAGGVSGNLVERAADVMLKERRPLILVPRETPLNEIHLENMLRLARMGARMVPAMPAFYHHPACVSDMVDFIVGRVLDALTISHELYPRWGVVPEEGSK